MRISQLLLFTPRLCTDCQHFVPILKLQSKEPFGKCDRYRDPTGRTDALGYADCARLDQTKCGGGKWFTPKKKNTTESILILYPK